MTVRRLVAALVLPVAGVAMGCSSTSPTATPAPYVGTAGLIGARTSGGKLALILEINTVFGSTEDEHPDAQHLFTAGRIAFAGRSATARRTAARTDLRSKGADGSQQATSVWIDRWRAVLRAPHGLKTGVYLVIFTGCRAGARGCQRSVVPVCVRGSRIIGEPVNREGGLTGAAGYGREPGWWSVFTCRHPVKGAGLSAANDADPERPAPQRLPAHPAGRVYATAVGS
jgi:hypothetical protein